MWFGHLVSKIRPWDYQAWEELAPLTLLILAIGQPKQVTLSLYKTSIMVPPL